MYDSVGEVNSVIVHRYQSVFAAKYEQFYCLLMMILFARYLVYGFGLQGGNKVNIDQSTYFSASGLARDQEYSFGLTCVIDDIELPGPIKVISAKTRSCTGK